MIGLLKFIKAKLAKKNLYIQNPVSLRKPLVEGKIYVIEPYDLEVDQAKRRNEEAKRNALPHPVDKEDW